MSETQVELLSRERRDSEALTAPAPDNTAALIERLIEKGITTENVAAIDKLVDLKLKIMDREAEREFNRAFVQLQAEVPSVKAERAVPDKNGGIKYHFADYEDIMAQVLPLLKKFGFAPTFSSVLNNGVLTQTCTLLHVGGHSKSNSFSARIGRGPPGATETQADGAANTYAKRYALCDALNIVVQHLDTDARAEESSAHFQPIAWEKVAHLKELLAQTKSELPMFLRFAQVDKLEDVDEKEYDRLVQAIQRKARA